MEKAAAVSEREALNLSSSVSSAASRFADGEGVTATALAKAILDLHRSDYAGGKASALSLDEDGIDGDKRPVQAWLEDVRTLFEETLAPKLHGRLVIIGLGLLEPLLRRQLEQDGFLAALKQELKEPLDELLTARGQALCELPDSVPTQPDDPLREINDDQLGRAAFARFLVMRIFAIPPDSHAYAIHLSGPWGSGKSTLLNFLRWELENNWVHYTDRSRWTAQISSSQDQSQEQPEPQAQPFLVVNFNAWQHQHVRPPWWSLMDQIFRQSKRRLRFADRFAEYWWRLSSGRLTYLIGLAVIAWLLILILPSLLGNTAEGLSDFGNLAGTAENIGKILGLLVMIWAGIQAASKPLLLRSAQAAQSYTEVTGDPMNEIKRRFNKLIKRIERSKPVERGRKNEESTQKASEHSGLVERARRNDERNRHRVRVAVFIDDLDRCQSTYVVELLEGIQTLFREAPVVFVVAADRRWLNACFETVYCDLKPLVHEPGKPLGTLFLEKAFQFSTSVPSIPDDLKKEYWESLIKLQSDPQTLAALESARKSARESLAKTRTEGEIIWMTNRNGSFLEKRAIREEAVKHLASPVVQQQIEHVLKPYASFLEHNPRSMKRLVNSYSANRALATLAHLVINRDQLALWTILSLRWPRLAEPLKRTLRG